MVVANTVVYNPSCLAWDPANEAFLATASTDGPSYRIDSHVSPLLRDSTPSVVASRAGVVLQLGGNEPGMLQEAARVAVCDYGYRALNLNCGCPSSRVAGKGCFGAALMREPGLVAECCLAMMRGAADEEVEVSVKCRIGVDNADSYEELRAFVSEVSRGANVRHFVIHARKAWLKGLSTAANRSIPPLRYEFVLRLLSDFPSIRFTINGGIASIRAAAELARSCGGIMVGRAAYKASWILAGFDKYLYGRAASERGGGGVTRRSVIDKYLRYADEYFLAKLRLAIESGWDASMKMREGSAEETDYLSLADVQKSDTEGRENPNGTFQDVLKPLWGFFKGERGCKKYIKALDDGMAEVRRKCRDRCALEEFPLPSTIIARALEKVDASALDTPYNAEYDEALQLEHDKTQAQLEEQREKHFKGKYKYLLMASGAVEVS